jgi:ABC-type antimicrobial peptide transport system permease subunit
VTSDYLETMGMPLIAGRGFDAAQAPDAPVAVVTAALASRLGLGPDPIGRTLSIDDSDLSLEVVGVVADAKYFDLREEPVPTAFVPKEVLPDARSYTDFVVRSSQPFDALRGALTEALAAAAPQLHVDVRRLEDSIESGLVRERLLSTLSAFFGLLAAFVAAIGLYGVMAHHVSQRRGEIGVRIALGADRRHVLAAVLLQAGATHFTGIALGALVASLAAMPARQLLFGIDAHSARAYLTAAAVLTVAAALASYLPARRATRTDPRQALSGE